MRVVQHQCPVVLLVDETDEESICCYVGKERRVHYRASGTEMDKQSVYVNEPETGIDYVCYAAYDD